ncbi:MAG: RidA family protein [Pseudomonadota bacterium]|nr:RidA family protein [Pseudomonadota bacterium]
MGGLLTIAAAGLSQAAEPSGVKRYKIPGSDFPIALAVEVPASATVVYHSGFTPAPADASAEQYSRAYWGDTETQALSTLGRLEKSLKSLGLGMKDVVKMQVFLVGDPELGGRLDFAGFMRAYTRYFGTDEQPNLPARSAMQVAGLARPGMWVEIEVMLVRPE